MQNDAKISVIVPIYNVEKYLEKCIVSIVNQTYKNLEIILVDDESPDNCPEICDKWAEKDSRIKVIHKKNGGLSDARNAGLEVATGDLIGFVDSDDWISVYMYEMLKNALDSTGADVAECNSIMVYEGDVTEDKKNSDCNVKSYTAVQSLKLLATEKKFRHTAWNKLYRRSVIGDIRFEVGKIHEDVFWTYQIFGRSKNVTKVEDNLYYYLQRQNSIMGTAFSLKNLSGLEAKKRFYDYVSINFPEISARVGFSLYFTGIYFGQRALMTKDKELISEAFNDILKLIKPVKIKLSDIKPQNRVWYLISKVSLRLCCKLRNLFNIGM